MSKENYTHIVCLIDRSGSMGSIREDAQGGFNAFVEEQKKVPGEATITLVQFDTQYETVWENKPLKEVENYVLMPRGGTALLDALGRTVNETGKFLEGMSESERPSNVVFMVLTDGMENSSKEFKKQQINEMIKHQQDAYSWEFNFLAANQDAIGEAVALGFVAGNAMNFAPTGKGVRSAMAEYSCSMSRYRKSGGDSSALNLPEFADDEAKKAAEKSSSSSS